MQDKDRTGDNKTVYFISPFCLAFFFVHFLWPCWTLWMWHGARKQWNLLPFQRPALTCSLKSVEKYRLLCFVCCRHSQQWPAEYSNHDAISQSRTTLAGSTTDLKLCRNTWTLRVCVHVCPNHTNCQHNGGLIKLPAQKFSSIELLPLIWPINSLESIFNLNLFSKLTWWGKSISFTGDTHWCYLGKIRQVKDKEWFHFLSHKENVSNCQTWS